MIIVKVEMRIRKEEREKKKKFCKERGEWGNPIKNNCVHNLLEKLIQISTY